MNIVVTTTYVTGYNLQKKLQIIEVSVPVIGTPQNSKVMVRVTVIAYEVVMHFPSPSPTSVKKKNRTGSDVTRSES